MTIAQQIADFICAFDGESDRARHIAQHAIFDVLTATIVGLQSEGGRAAHAAAKLSWGKGAASCWFSPDRLSAAGAAFSNSAMASMLDLDDGHRMAAGHPGAAIIPAVLATAQVHDCDADSSLSAMTLGYEIAVRIASARDINSLDTLVSGPWCGQGVAAAVGWLRGLSAEQIAQAIAIAGSTAPNLVAVGYSKIMGNHVKEGIAWATATGMAAVDLAVAGFTGPIDLFDNADIYNAEVLLNGLNRRWLIETLYFKPYSCCRWSHAAIDALLELQAAQSIVVDNIKSIDVNTFSRALRLNNHTVPLNLECAQYSVPFCLALAAVRGAEALLPLRESSITDRDVLALAQRVNLNVDSTLDAMFPAAVPAQVSIITGDGRCLSRTVINPMGEASNPMGWNALEEKFDRATAGLVDISVARQIKTAVHALDTGQIKPLLTVLALPLKATMVAVATESGSELSVEGLSARKLSAEEPSADTRVPG